MYTIYCAHKYSGNFSFQMSLGEERRGGGVRFENVDMLKALKHKNSYNRNSFIITENITTLQLIAY